MNFNIIKFTAKSLIVFATIALVNSCAKPDHYYKDYLEKRYYIGKIDSIDILPGKHRAQIVWSNPSDPKANELVIYWNNYTDSVKKVLNPTLSTESLIIDNLTEGEHTFYFLTKSLDNFTSLPTEITTKIYGDVMQGSIDNIHREIDYVVILKDSTVFFWKPIQNDNILGSEIQFYDKSNTLRRQIVPVADVQSTIYNVSTDKLVSVRGVFTPDPGTSILDSFYSHKEDFSLFDKQLRTLFLTGAGATTGDFIDLMMVKNYPRDQQPNPSTIAGSIDIVHQRGTGSKQNLFTANSNQFGPFSSDLNEYMNSWSRRNQGLFISLGNGTAAQELYDGLDENNRAEFQEAYETSALSYSQVNRLTGVATGNIILFYSIDRDMYAAIKAVNSEPDGNLTIEFKVSRF